MQVSTTWLTEGDFHLWLFLLKLFVVINSLAESCQRLFPSFFELAHEVVVKFIWILRGLLFLGQNVDLDQLFCTGFEFVHGDLLLCLYFTQNPLSDQFIYAT